MDIAEPSCWLGLNVYRLEKGGGTTLVDIAEPSFWLGLDVYPLEKGGGTTLMDIAKPSFCLGLDKVGEDWDAWRKNGVVRVSLVGK
jgi:hypothetical protein